MTLKQLQEIRDKLLATRKDKAEGYADGVLDMYLELKKEVNDG